jgi:transcriptional regulator with XRE-family HTH domain
MNKLQNRRKAAGLSQSQLAAKVGISVRTLQHLESGFRDINKAAALTVYRMAVELRCDVSDLLELEAPEAADGEYLPF